MAEIIIDGSQKELKKHGSDEFPLLVSYEQLSGYKSGSFLWHWHPEIEITLVLDGQILYKVNQVTQPILRITRIKQIQQQTVRLIKIKITPLIIPATILPTQVTTPMYLQRMSHY